MAWKGFKGPGLRLSPQPIDIAVVVPTRGRPGHAGPFMDSLRESTDRCRAYAVCHADEAECVSAWTAAGANVLTTWDHPFGPKVNHAYRSTGESWLFVTGDDVRFHAGWADELIRVVGVAAEKAGRRPSVIGTNDLANPRVMRGEHATHMLIDRQYIADVGASWDGPGWAWPECYGHMFSDDEVVTKAKQLGVFAMALDSVVEHLNPIVHKAELDDTYRLGWASGDADRDLFQSRMVANAR
jgi:hypothetical protein